MGCKVKIRGYVREIGQWNEIDSETFNFQNYPSFTLMGWVGNHYLPEDCVKPIAETKGLPDDLKYQSSTKLIGQDEEDYLYELLGVGTSGISYLTLKEMIDYKDWDRVVTERGEVATLREHASCLIKIMDYLSSLPHAPEDVRIVFGFDY